MKLYRKIFAGLLALTMVASIMTGCNNNDSTQTDDSSTEQVDSSDSSSNSTDSNTVGDSQEDNTIPDNLDYTDEITDGAVLSINGHDIDVEEYRYYFLNIKHQYDNGADSYWVGEETDVTDAEGNTTHQTAEENLREKLSTVKEHTLSVIINNYCVELLAKDKNIELTADELAEVEENYNETKEAYENDESADYDTFEDYLTAIYCNKDIYMKMISRRYLEEKVIKTLYEDDFRENLLPQYNHCEHILFSTLNLQVETEEVPEDATDEEKAEIEARNAEVQSKAKEEVKAKAEEVLQQIKDGADFEEMLAEYNEDPGETVNEDGSVEGYYFKEGTMVQEFEDAFFALGDNEVSDLVETSYGYHIIKRIPITDDDKYVNENIINLIMQDNNTYETTEYYDQYMELADSYCDSMNIDYKELYYNINSTSLPYQSSVFPYMAPPSDDVE